MCRPWSAFGSIAVLAGEADRATGRGSAVGVGRMESCNAAGWAGLLCKPPQRLGVIACFLGGAQEAAAQWLVETPALACLPFVRLAAGSVAPMPLPPDQVSACPKARNVMWMRARSR